MTQITMTEIIGTEIMMVKVILTGVDDGTIIVEVKDIVIVEEVDDGILASNIMTLGTAGTPISRPKSLSTSSHGTSIQIPNPIWSISIPVPATTVLVTNANPSQQAANICQLCYSQGTMTINANLQVILWHAHKKLSIKADHTVTKTQITGNGHKVTVTTMTQMGNLFSSGGSRCR